MKLSELQSQPGLPAQHTDWIEAGWKKGGLRDVELLSAHRQRICFHSQVGVAGRHRSEHRSEILGFICPAHCLQQELQRFQLRILTPSRQDNTTNSKIGGGLSQHVISKTVKLKYLYFKAQGQGTGEGRHFPHQPTLHLKYQERAGGGGE